VIDSALDLFSGTVIWATNRFMKTSDRYLFPTGKGRFEPVVTIILAAVMATAAIQLISSACQELVNNTAEVIMTPLYTDFDITVVLFVCACIRRRRYDCAGECGLARPRCHNTPADWGKKQQKLRPRCVQFGGPLSGRWSFSG